LVYNFGFKLITFIFDPWLFTIIIILNSAFKRAPVGRNGGKVEDEIVVDKLVGMFSEPLLLLKCSYCAAASDRLTEMNVDR